MATGAVDEPISIPPPVAELESIVVSEGGAPIAPAAEARPAKHRSLAKIKSGVQQLATLVGVDKRKISRLGSSARMGLKGLRFFDNASGGKDGWKTVEKRFDELAVHGRLPKDQFGRCIGNPLDLLRKALDLEANTLLSLV